jgi:hypothetical protein
MSGILVFVRKAEYMLSRVRYGNRFSFVDFVSYGLSLVHG